MISLKFSLNTADAKKFTALLKRAPEVTKEELLAATLESLLLLENLTKDGTPIGATSLLRGAWAHELMGAPDDGSVLGRVFNPLGYAAPVEMGTKPHWAPLDPLIDWVKAKLDVRDDAEAKQVARLIQFKIAAKGTTGSHMAQHALDVATPDMRQAYRNAQTRALARIGLE